MIDNYIPGDFVRVNRQIVMILGIEHTENKYTVGIVKNYLDGIDPKDIKPIKITSEILESIGWKKVSGKDIGMGSDYVFISEENRPTIIMERGNFYHTLFGKTRLTYLHQLQHLLFGLGLKNLV